MDVRPYYAAVIASSMRWDSLAHATRHARGDDSICALRRREDATARCLAWSKAAGIDAGYRVCGVGEQADETDYVAAYAAHKRHLHAVDPRQRDAQIGLHILLVVTPEVLGDAYGERHDPTSPAVRQLCDTARGWTDECFGADSTFAVRYDVDEHGSCVVDCLVAPVRVQTQSGRRKAGAAPVHRNVVAPRMARQELRRRHPPYIGRDGKRRWQRDYTCMQTEWAAYAKAHFDSRLERGRPKAITHVDHLLPEDYGAAKDAAAEIVADREQARQERAAASDERAAVEAWAAQQRAEAKADRQAALQSRRLADAARKAERALHRKQSAALARREQAVAKREARADARDKAVAERKAEIAALDVRLVELRAEAQQIVDTNDVLRAEAAEHGRVRMATMVASDQARAEADILPSEADLEAALGIDYGDGSGMGLRWRDAAGALLDVVLQMGADGREERVATIGRQPGDPFQTLRLFPFGDALADAIKYARRGDAAQELGAGLVQVFKALLRAGRVPRMVQVEQEREQGLVR